MQALEALRKLRLEKVQECKELKLQLEHLRTHKQAAHRLRSDVDQGGQREKALTAQIQALEAQLAEHSQVNPFLWHCLWYCSITLFAAPKQLAVVDVQEQAELNAQMQEWQEVQDRLAALRTRHEVLVKAAAARQEQLISAYGEDELDVTIEELKGFQEELAPTLARNIARIDELEIEIQVSLLTSGAVFLLSMSLGVTIGGTCRRRAAGRMRSRSSMLRR